ncbi:hypothetical protein CAPTEDRAFT_201238 [Capitella teleta]|uniref:Uncharacterized protein n=1 Tax=Capitella teleta TaxID=283909 RepID=R7V1R4_CAPTE|nr:hypothetical protein CAPTEDRAFT_201238 [Capitella teleta]|eukprot:ELU10261.1 hypothetical protein CAPTEDRAFT_201238 [Capitella teleta]
MSSSPIAHPASQRQRYLQRIRSMNPSQLLRRLNQHGVTPNEFIIRRSLSDFVKSQHNGMTHETATRAFYQALYIIKMKTFKKDCHLWRHKFADAVSEMDSVEMDNYEQSMRVMNTLDELHGCRIVKQEDKVIVVEDGTQDLVAHFRSVADNLRNVNPEIKENVVKENVDADSKRIKLNENDYIFI